MTPINYKFNDLDEARTLSVVMDQKMAALEKYLSANSSATCEVEFEKIGNHQHGRIYRVEANISVDGTLFRAEATEDSFEKAIDEVRDELDKELRNAKDKRHTRDVAAGRAFKEQLASE